MSLAPVIDLLVLYVAQEMRHETNGSSSLKFHFEYNILSHVEKCKGNYRVRDSLERTAFFGSAGPSRFAQ